MAGRYWTGAGYTAHWTGLALSADGTRIVAVATDAPIALSPDGGLTWHRRGAALRWNSVASSADGNRLAATVSGGRIWVSDNAGETWAARGDSGDWRAIVSSADGQRLMAVQGTGLVAVSSDAGSRWSQLLNTGRWEYAACSADGLTLGIASYGGGQVYSTTGGEIWEPMLTSDGLERFLPTIAGGPICVSTDGTRWLIAEPLGGIWSWVSVRPTAQPRLLPGTNHRGKDVSWSAIACSASGERIVAAESSGTIWHSANRGQTWVRSPGIEQWTSVACSSDGGTLVASPGEGELALSTVWFVGPPTSTAEFVFAGNGRWCGHTYATLEPDLRFAVDRIPDLPAERITSGTLSAARLPPQSPLGLTAPVPANHATSDRAEPDPARLQSLEHLRQTFDERLAAKDSELKALQRRLRRLGSGLGLNESSLPRACFEEMESRIGD